MKFKRYNVILLVALTLFLFTNAATFAAIEPSNADVQGHIKILLEKIASLKSLIATLTMQQDILADSYFVMDISNNKVVLEKNINQLYSIASITKLMNAVVTVENIDQGQSITLTSEMLKPYGYSPSLFLNSKVKARDLLRASLIQSTNDAAESLSYFVGKGKFLELMNQKADDLGMSSTQFFDVHGMDVRNRSTASDLAKLVSYINQNHSSIWSITKDNDFWLPDPTGKMLKFKNLNVFHDNSEFIGGKTGYLKEAKESMASIFEINGKKFLVITLKSPNRKADILKIIDKVKSI